MKSVTKGPVFAVLDETRYHFL